MAKTDIKLVEQVTLLGTLAGLVSMTSSQSGILAEDQDKSLVYLVCKIVYATYFDKLRHIPGPRLNAISMIPYARHLLAGTTVANSVKLHSKYGDVVRISPIEVSFTSADTAFPDIYGT